MFIGQLRYVFKESLVGYDGFKLFESLGPCYKQKENVDVWLAIISSRTWLKKNSDSFCYGLFCFAKRTGSIYWQVLPLLNHFLSCCKGPCEHLGKASECPSCTLVTWLDIESHLASTCLPSPLLLAAHQYKWLEILCFQSPRTAHDFFLASASIFLEMSGLKFGKKNQIRTFKLI